MKKQNYLLWFDEIEDVLTTERHTDSVEVQLMVEDDEGD